MHETTFAEYRQAIAEQEARDRARFTGTDPDVAPAMTPLDDMSNWKPVGTPIAWGGWAKRADDTIDYILKQDVDQRVSEGVILFTDWLRDQGFASLHEMYAAVTHVASVMAKSIVAIMAEPDLEWYWRITTNRQPTGVSRRGRARAIAALRAGKRLG